MSEIPKLIAQVKAVTGTHVVIRLTPAGLRWVDEDESCCLLIATIAGDCSVMPREKFIADLEKIMIENPSPQP